MSKLLTLFLNLIFTMIILFIAFVIVLTNQEYIHNIIQYHKLEYYLIVSSILFIGLPITNIFIFKYCYNNLKIQKMLLKMFD